MNRHGEGRPRWLADSPTTRRIRKEVDAAAASDRTGVRRTSAMRRPGWAPNRYIPGGSVPSDDAACSMARSRRRTRLRTTAGPRARPSANATRGGVAMPGGSRMYVHHSTPARARWPSAAKRANARRSRMRQIKPTDGGGPWRGVTSARPGRRGCSSGGGSRASWPGDGCWVGRCASRSPPRAAHGSTYGSTLNVRNGALQNTSKRQNSRPDYGRATAQWQPGGAWCLATVPFGVGREFGSVRPSRPMVVHTMWTSMWISIDRQEGGAGERPRTAVDSRRATPPRAGVRGRVVLHLPGRGGPGQ